MSFLSRIWLNIFGVVALLCIFLISSISFFPPHAPLLGSQLNHEQFKSASRNVWADLDASEAEDLTKFLFKRPDLNLTRFEQGSSWDNILLFIETLPPKKSAALSYIESHSEPPSRWARVVVSQGSTRDAGVAFYKAGPLPITNQSTVEPFVFNSGCNRVSNPVPDYFELVSWALKFGSSASDVTEALLGGKIDLLNLHGIHSVIARPAWIEKRSMLVWLQFYRSGLGDDAFSLLPQGLWFQLKLEGRDLEKWEMLEWYYNGVLYETIDDLRAAIRTPGFQTTPLNLNGNWTDTQDARPGPPGREKQGPVMIQPNGPRYQLDKAQRFVSWMGFEFFVTTRQTTGLVLWDIRFNGDRIIYELGLQEAIAHYAGDDPTQGGLEWFDSFFGMGRAMFELVPGYDCPAYATYLDTTSHSGENTITNKNSICIFEYASDAPLQRHTSASSVSVSRNTYLVVRSVSTVGNYDYTIDYLFYLDGTIEVKVRASGFIFAAFWRPTNFSSKNEYSYRIHDAAATSMHDHVINFKADLDVAGTANTLKRVGIEPVTRSYSWDDEKTTPRHTMQLVHRSIDIEAGLDWPRNAGEMYIVTNNDTENIWGEKRGYRIMPGTGIGTPPHLTILNSTTGGRSADWAQRDLWVVKQHDSEESSGNPFNVLDPLHPLVDWKKIANGEGIVQEDLVLYFNLGAHHVPHSGDIPNTLMHTSASSVMFTPFNFHDRDPSRRSVHGVTMRLHPDGHDLEYFGGRYEKGVKLDVTDLEPDLTQYDANEHAVTDLSWSKSMLVPLSEGMGRQRGGGSKHEVHDDIRP